jgi:hypothetical protein
MADRGWKRPFDDPIPLPGGPATRNLRDAARYIQSLLDVARAAAKPAAMALKQKTRLDKPGSLLRVFRFSLLFGAPPLVLFQPAQEASGIIFAEFVGLTVSPWAPIARQRTGPF